MHISIYIIIYIFATLNRIDGVRYAFPRVEALGVTAGEVIYICIYVYVNVHIYHMHIYIYIIIYIFAPLNRIDGVGYAFPGV